MNGHGSGVMAEWAPSAARHPAGGHGAYAAHAAAMAPTGPGLLRKHHGVCKWFSVEKARARHGFLRCDAARRRVVSRRRGLAAPGDGARLSGPPTRRFVLFTSPSMMLMSILRWPVAFLLVPPGLRVHLARGRRLGRVCAPHGHRLLRAARRHNTQHRKRHAAKNHFLISAETCDAH